MMRASFLVLLLFASQSVVAVECQEKTFLEFFAKFAVDREFSQLRTSWPLRVTNELFGERKTRQISQINSRSENWAVEKPIFDFLRDNPGMGISVSAETKSKVVLTFGIEDADIVFDLKFAKQRGCWTLVEVRGFDR